MSSESLARIISKEHCARIKKLVDECKGTVICGGTAVVDEKYMAPTIITGTYTCDG
jgi:hypothetical protein